VLDFALLPACANAQNAYITNVSDGTVSVIDTATNTVTATITVPSPNLWAVAVTPDGIKVYVVNESDGTVSVISTVTDTIAGSHAVVSLPRSSTLRRRRLPY
jgi:YVTN family beta-propeller protein